MKIKNILLGVALLGGLTACADFLEENSNPNYLSPGTFWKSEEDIMKGLTAAYAAMQPNTSWAVPYERYIVIDSYRSDECDFRPDVPEWEQIAMFTNESTNPVTRKEWTNLYVGINFANQCIDNIPNVPGDEGEIAESKKQGIAEARFLRAYYYYRLYLNYGERIPMFTKQIQGSDEEYFPAQAEPGVLVQFIESELKDVQADLPESYSAEWGGRATRYAAAAILGKFYMFRHELSKAEAEFKKIIDSGKFDLVENYNDNFDGLHENNKESILEVQFTGNMSGDHYEYNLWTIHLQAMNAYGYEEAYPTPWIFETLKKDLTVDGKYSTRCTSTIIFDDPDCRPWYYGAGDTFLDWHNEGEYFWHKWVTYDESHGPEWDYGGFNFPVVRYADILLLYAECLNDRGQSAEAVDYINIVRARANVPALDHGMSKDAVLKHLQDVERPCELALEGVRWYDLVRWGIVKETLVAHNKPHIENYIDSKHKLFPIPHNEFLLNHDWEQNPGFSK